MISWIINKKIVSNWLHAYVHIVASFHRGSSTVKRTLCLSPLHIHRLVPFCFQQNENNALCVSHPQTPLLLPVLTNSSIPRYENMLILVITCEGEGNEILKGLEYLMDPVVNEVYMATFKQS